MDLQELKWGGIDWIDLARDREKWRALANAVMNFRVPSNAANCLTNENLLASQEALCSLELVSYLTLKIYNANRDT